MRGANGVERRMVGLLAVALLLTQGAILDASSLQGEEVRVDCRGRVLGDNLGSIPRSGATGDSVVRTSVSVTVLIYYPELDTPDRLRSLGYQVTDTIDAGDLARENLQNYDVLWIDVGNGGQWPPSYSGPIQAWIAEDGGGLIYVQPNTAGDVTLFPPGFEVTVYDAACPEWPAHCLSTIIDPTHPITEGLEDSDLTSNGDWVRTIDIGPSWDILAVDPLLPDDAVALIAGEYGEGRMVFTTGNYSTYSIDYGSDQYVIQLLTWLSQKEPPPPPWSIAATVRGTSKEGTDDSSMLNHLAFLLLPLAVVMVLRTRRRRRR